VAAAQFMPTVYLTSSAAVTAVRRGTARAPTAACVGSSGRAYSIMRKPRAAYGELLDGRVLAFTPPLRLFEAVQEARHAPQGSTDMDAAWQTYEAGLRYAWASEWHRARVRPGELGFGRLAGAREVHDPNRVAWDGEWWVPVGLVQDGDTLCCGCGAETARAGRCHRVIAAELLAEAGWWVVLDGVPYFLGLD
jgi:hypothetical protein